MSALDQPHADVRPVVGDLRTYAIIAVAVLFSLLTIYALLYAPQTVLHELAHDGRHLLGAPCH
ncbi:CbtB domain-containing protein [Actinocorallia longicatena]|uniref:Cobalt transporter subunit CbtB n=1 Tax=Actinocorallia longicatena TaxID=111803 RepID=A0ABP6PZF8_9ACTN